MSQKPINKRTPQEGRSAIWAAIRRLQVFILSDIYAITACSKDSIREYLTCLLAGGYLLVHADTTGTTITTYYLVKDVGIDAPRLRRDGTEITQGRSRENLWRTIRILRDFTPRELAINARTDDVDISEVEAKNYVYHLHRAGYLALINPARSGSRQTAGQQARYRLLPSKNTGPLPPMVQRIKQVYDQNTRRIVWSSQEGGSDHVE